ncbi:MAG: phospholipase A [Dechloromonas sp.]|nr:phospholipase A [Dechloromonas sp.]
MSLLNRPLALLMLVLPGLVSAQTLADCRSIPGAERRLACYDQLPVSTIAVLPATRQVSGQTGVPAPRSSSLLGQAWELDDGERGQILRIRQYKPVYVLPAFHASRVNHFPSSPASGHASISSADVDATETKYQISLKAKLFEDLLGDNGDLWFGYTQSSRWQVFNSNTSRPFRETNYEPELMFLWRTNSPLAGWRVRTLGLGINHQSNGRSLPLSRSWNRMIGTLALEKEEWTVTFRPWWRIPESRDQDDNPDIANYLGRGDLQVIRHFGDQELSVMLRHSLRSGGNSHGAVQLDYAFPLAGKLRGHLQWFSGYGESLIDYNHRANYYGVGLSLLEWY